MATHEVIVTVGRNNVAAVFDDGATVSDEHTDQDVIDEQLIGVFTSWLRDGSRKWDSRDLSAFGSLLFRFLLDGDVGTFLDRRIDELHDGDDIRVQLTFGAGASRLASIPWEYLYVPDRVGRQGFHLATDRRVILSRYLPLEHGRVRLPPETPPLRMLVLVSQPPGLGPVVPGPLLGKLTELEAAHPDRIEIGKPLQDPTFDALRAELRTRRPHILHYIGHGDYDEINARGQIALKDDNSSDPWWCSDQDFAEIVTRDRNAPRIVVLHSCEGATTSPMVPFAGLAPHLIRAGVQAAVAMQFAVSNRAAILFSTTLYSELLAGQPLDRAVQEARWKLTGVGTVSSDARMLGVPVLYLNSVDAVVAPADTEPAGGEG